MHGIERRLSKLEGRGARGGTSMHLVVMQAGTEFSLSTGRCLEILRAGGFVRAGEVMSLLDFSGVPAGLDSEALERHLREHGAEICRYSSVSPDQELICQVVQVRV